jgi:predicted DNA-binding protein
VTRDIKALLAEEAEFSEQEREKTPKNLQRANRQPESPSQVYSVRVPVDRIEMLRIVAARLGKAPSALIREWVIENLDRVEFESKATESTVRFVSSVDYSLDIRRQIKAAVRDSTSVRRAML